MGIRVVIIGVSIVIAIVSITIIIHLDGALNAIGFAGNVNEFAKRLGNAMTIVLAVRVIVQTKSS